MKVFNFKEFYNAFETGFVQKNKTAICTILFKPLFDPGELLDENGIPYEIGNNNASKWTNLSSPIPENIRLAVADETYIEDIILYFERDVISSFNDKRLLQDALDNMYNAVKQSNLANTRKQELIDYYCNQQYGLFFAWAFIAAVINSGVKASKAEKINEEITKTDEDVLDNFRRIIKTQYKKPSPLPIPDVSEDKGLGYVEALFEAYSQTAGKKISHIDDLGIYKNHFNRQRKYYYLAETIHREVRDAIDDGDDSSFEELKDEIEIGVEEPLEDKYSNPVEKIDAVIKTAEQTEISRHTQDLLMGWIGPGEKKGVCHMLVNDERIKWIDHENGQDKSF